MPKILSDTFLSYVPTLENKISKCLAADEPVAYRNIDVL